MNVLFFVPEYKSGGAEQTVKNLIAYFSKICPDLNVYECVMRKNSAEENASLVVLKHDAKKVKNPLAKTYLKFAQIIELHKIKKELDIDVSVSFIWGADIVNYFSGGKDKKIISIRNNLTVTLNKINLFRRRLALRCMRKADCVVALSQSVEREIRTEYRKFYKKICTIYNPAPDFVLSEVAPLISMLKEKNKKLIITAGRLTEQKGQWRLLKALKYIEDYDKDVEVIILGKGKLESRLKKLACSLEIDKKVHFVGFVENPADYIGYCDVFVFPSLSEGMGNVLIEALMIGIPIIASDCPYGPREILTKSINNIGCEQIEYAEYGILIPNGTLDIDNLEINKDECLLGEAILHLLRNENLQLQYKAKSRERIEDFEPEKVIHDWISLFYEMV